jgi:hypothetical protein
MNLKNDLKEFEDWRLVGVNGASVSDKIVDWGVQILLEGKYKDTILVFGEMSFDEVEENESAQMSFEYNIFHSPNTNVIQNEELNEIAGDIMVSVLEKAIDEGKAVFNEREPEQDHTTITLDE